MGSRHKTFVVIIIIITYSINAILGEIDYMDMTTTRCVGLMWTFYLIEHMCLSGSHMTRLVVENGHRKHVSR